MDLILQNIIAGCKRQQRASQKALYLKYVNSLMSICQRYVTNDVDAEEILNNAFLRIFKHIGQFDNKGSFEGWLKRITVNCCLTYISKPNFINRTKIIPLQHENGDDVMLFTGSSFSLTENGTEDKYRKEYLLKLLLHLPDTVRLVFNLYVFEDYNHREIGELLNIAERTSQAHLANARKLLGEALDKKKLMHKLQRI
ncbi:MAG: sigma-70 family RNA polymerase sigma factor [Ferruginibacter sp.]